MVKFKGKDGAIFPLFSGDGFSDWNNSDSPFSAHFGDLEAEVNRVETGRLPLQDLVTPPGFVSLQGETQHRDVNNVDSFFRQWQHNPCAFVVHPAQ